MVKLLLCIRLIYVFILVCVQKDYLQFSNLENKPWIKIDAAGKEEIMQQVQKCPTKALSFYINIPEKKSSEEPVAIESGFKVKVLSKGPSE